jgi:hypothetical protein
MPGLVWTSILLHTLPLAGMTSMYYHSQLFIGLDGVSLSFCLGWP